MRTCLLKWIPLLFLYLIPGMALVPAQVRDTASGMDVTDLLHRILKKPDTLPNVKSLIGPPPAPCVQASTCMPADSMPKKSLGPFYTFIPYPGYAMVTGFLVGIVQNLAFYTFRSDQAKLSNLQLDNVYSQYNQYINILNSTIWLPGNRFNLSGDWRFYQFPTNTFGLGSKSSFSDVIPVDYAHLKIYEALMGKLLGDLSGGLGINYDNHWNISQIRPPVEQITELDRYGFPNRTISSGLTLNLLFDNRLNCNNPGGGAYVFLQFRDNLKLIGSDANWQSLLLDARFYVKPSKKSPNVLAFWAYCNLTLSGTPPYFDLPASGMDTYDNTCRAYVEARYRGLNMIDAEAEYRFGLLKNGLLGGVVFFNASGFSEWPDNRLERINPAGGAGLRIKMNKKSKTNLCVDYGFGADGSRGFSFNLNEVF